MKPKESTMAAKYAYAAYAVAKERKSLAVVLNDMGEVYSLFNNNEDIKKLFNNPTIGRSEKITLIKKILSGKVSRHFMDILILVIRRKRESLFGEIYKIFSGLIDDENGVLRGKIQTAVGIEEAKLKTIQEKLSVIYKKNVVLESEIDESIIGGVVVKIKNKIIDGSLSGTLNRMKKELVYGN